MKVIQKIIDAGDKGVLMSDLAQEFGLTREQVAKKVAAYRKGGGQIEDRSSPSGEPSFFYVHSQRQQS